VNMVLANKIDSEGQMVRTVVDEAGDLVLMFYVWGTNINEIGADLREYCELLKASGPVFPREPPPLAAVLEAVAAAEKTPLTDAQRRAGDAKLYMVTTESDGAFPWWVRERYCEFVAERTKSLQAFTSTVEGARRLYRMGGVPHKQMIDYVSLREAETVWSVALAALKVPHNVVERSRENQLTSAIWNVDMAEIKRLLDSGLPRGRPHLQRDYWHTDGGPSPAYSDAPDFARMTLENVAENHCHLATIVQLLHKHGASFKNTYSLKDSRGMERSGWSLIHMAVNDERPDYIKILRTLPRGAVDFDAKTVRPIGWTAAVLAQELAKKWNPSTGYRACLAVLTGH